MIDLLGARSCHTAAHPWRGLHPRRNATPDLGKQGGENLNGLLAWVTDTVQEPLPRWVLNMKRIDENNCVTDEDGALFTHFVDSIATFEMHFPSVSVIGVRLFDSSEDHNGTLADDQAHQFRMSPDSARRLAKALTKAADGIEGVGQSRQ